MIISLFYVFNAVFDGEYDRKLKKKILKMPQPGFEPTPLWEISSPPQNRNVADLNHATS